MTTTTTSPEQLSWLPEPTVPARFRLDQATRRRGLSHVAEIRARLADADERRAALRAEVAPRRLLGAPKLAAVATTAADQPASIAPLDAAAASHAA